jgi:hypothetical protein
MSWTPILVIAAIAILVPTALVAAFASTKDTHQYSAHYGKHGFTQEPQEELLQLADAKHPSADSEQSSNGHFESLHHGSAARYQQPVTEWPTEL